MKNTPSKLGALFALLNAANCAKSYKLRVKQDSKQTIPLLKKNGLTTTTFAKKFDKGHLYYWKVLACNSFGCVGSAWLTFSVQH
jgi:hypothetical protein